MAVSLGYKNVYRDPYGFPKWQDKGLPINSAPAGLTASLEAAASVPSAQSLQGWAMLWTLLGIFAGGLALNLTPCVYPMIPITVSFFGGRAAQEKPNQLKLVAHGLCYLMGLALTNSILGVVAALTGGLMGAILQSPLVLTIIAVVLVLFATSLFGLWELRLPGSLNQMAAKSYTGYFGSLFMGLTLGVVAAPCIGPFVLGLLTWVASMGDPWLGFLIFFILSLGMGLPLFVLAIFSGQLQRMPQAGGWMIWVRKLMGWVLVGMAVYFIRPIIPGAMKVIMPIGVALAAGLHLGWIDKNQASFKLFPWLKAIVGTVCLVFAAIWITAWIIRGPGVEWHTYSEKILQEAIVQNKVVIIDFYAEWCTPCREFEEIVFHDPDIVSLAEAGFILVKVDVTQGGNPLHEQLLKKYDIKGVPTIVFLDTLGIERLDLRLVDFLPPKQFLVHMGRVQKPL
ncbi:MAG: cytochrome C biogenesis protein [Desulfobulbaceae bacterium S3730MH12]|nr:MAG: cytochrome C biogenesis protein [Desulfobulbaceae bacterium S5133MH15]OEU58305.1 MAG: cytochrome C biogenesis protein [Desulfobulbaceae bacterium S3730MH12]OEU83522.1 MAG: cytochrome C biogenesis protein [Desulfobulbaceae bacterium C00003063]